MNTKPKIEIDLAKVEALASRLLTKEQIAISLGISEATFYNRQGENLEILEAIKRGREVGRGESRSSSSSSPGEGGGLGQGRDVELGVHPWTGGLGLQASSRAKGAWKFPSACISSAGKARSEIRGRRRREGPRLTVPRYEGTAQAGGRSRRPERAWSQGLGLTTWDPLAMQQGTWSGKPRGRCCEGAA